VTDGSIYRFFVRPGDPDKLMIYLQGGGGCWSRETCDPQMKATYTIRIEIADAELKLERE
jgi:hypothetical protein